MMALLLLLLPLLSALMPLGLASLPPASLPPAPPAPVPPQGRSLMIWLIDSQRDGPGKPDSDAIWAARARTLADHRQNLTHVSPCIYGFDAAGRFALQKAQAGTAKHLPLFSTLGLKIVPLIAADGGVGGLRALIKSPTPFINAAVAAAMKNNYSGYNFDNELRGRADARSWDFLRPYAAGWMAFLDQFADALHQVGRTLSVDIAGCCGWVDTVHPLAPAGHCAGAFATHEFVATTCDQYRSSKLDRVYGMSTYSGGLNGPLFQDTKDKNWYNATLITKTIANSTQVAIGKEKYSIGFKGRWPFCVNGSLPQTCVFDETAKETIRYVRDTLGVQHSASWVDEARSQAQWDAWGFWLRGV